MKKLPSRNELMLPTISAIKELGGSANTEEIFDKIVENLRLNDSLLEIINGKTGQSELQYNLSWVRTILKNQGVLSKVGKGIWILDENKQFDFKKSIVEDIKSEDEKDADEEVSDAEKWKKLTLEIITEKMS